MSKYFGSAFRTRDGYISFSAVTNEQFWGLCRAIGRGDLVGDERLDTLAKRTRERSLNREIVDCLRNFTTSEISLRFSEEDVPHGPVLRREDVIKDPQFTFSRTSEIEGRGGRTRLAVNPASFGNYETVSPGDSPGPGEHTSQIMNELGLGSYER